MKHIRQSQSGFTLLELLLYVAIVGSLLLVLSYFFVSSASTKASNQAENNINQQSLFIMETITQAIRNADSVSVPTANNTSTQLSLVVPAGGSSPTIFTLSGSTLTIKEGASAALALSTSNVVVSNLNFENVARASTPGSIQVSFTLATAPSTRSEFAYQRTFTTSASIRP